MQNIDVAAKGFGIRFENRKHCLIH
jgi:hypothetical protein